MSIGVFIQSLLPNYIAAFLPSNNVVSVAYTIWAFTAYFTGSWCWQSIKRWHDSGESIRKLKLVPPLVLMAVCLVGLLGGIIWLSGMTTLPQKAEIKKPAELIFRIDIASGAGHSDLQTDGSYLITEIGSWIKIMNLISQPLFFKIKRPEYVINNSLHPKWIC